MKTPIVTLALWWAACAPGCWAADLPDTLIADFEGPTYGDWKATGEAFGPGPARGTLPNQMAVEGFLGQGLVNSFYRGDGSTGTLTSPPITLQRRYLQFLIGGGMHPGQTCINLLVEGRVIRTATGPNDRPGGSERLAWHQWDISEFAGKTATLEIVDKATGGWGHLNVDHILQTDRRLPGLLTEVRRTLVVEKRLLNLPVKNGAPKRWVSLLVDGRLVREFEIELADADPDWWAFLELTPYLGKPLVLQVDRLPEDSRGLQAIEQSDTLKGAENLYREQWRPQFHFTSRRGWNNDPNGLVYQEGEWHLFYQHNPYGWNWGNMHWGHAVSRDLLHWQERGDALHPDELGTIFSGSAVVDANNTAGFQQGSEPALVCIYTAAGNTSRQSQGRRFSQCLAYSLDRGHTWTKYEQNPVLPHLVGDNRDPKVIWHAPSNRWILALYLDKNDYALFASPDLKRWERLSDVSLPGTSECPEFFELAVDGQPQNTRWVFYGGNGRYLVGRFDGKTFTPESAPLPLNFGNCFYASQTYNHVPASDGRRILVAWGQINLPGMPFNQMMDLPVELTLRTAADGLRLWANPVREIEQLRTQTRRFEKQRLAPGENPLADLRGELWDLFAEIAPGEAAEVGFKIQGVPVLYNAKQQVLTCQDKQAPLKLVDGRLRLRVLVDRVSMEIFGNDGLLYMPMGLIRAETSRPLELFARGGAAWLEHLSVHQLKSVW